jgi:predicted  nucleic acid-binding Zn-ribbon protein
MGSPFDNAKKIFLSGHSPEFSLRKVFVATLIVGTVFVILGSYSGFYSIGFMGPIGLMIIYIAIGRYINRGKFITEQFADSCYYLGFLFTLIALTVSLFSIKEEYNSSTLIWNFALALFTTIIGLGYKVYLSNFHDAADDSQKRAEGELTEAIDAYIDTIETARTGVDVYINELTDTGKKVVDSTLDNINKSSEALLKFNNELVESLGKTIVRSNVVLYDNIKTTYNMLNEGVEELISTLDNTCEEFKNKVNTIIFPDDIFISNLSEPIKNLEKSLSAVNNNFKKKITVQEKLLESSTTLTEKFDIISTRSEETSQGLNSLITQINTAANIHIDSDLINTQLFNLTGNLGEINKKIAPLVNLEIDFENINKVISNYEAIITSVNRKISNINKMSTDFVLLNENIGSTIASFDALNSKIEQATNINIDSGSINNQLSDLTNNLDGLNKKILPLSKLDNDFESINQVMGSYKDILDSINKRLAAITETGVDFVSLHENIGTAKTQLETFNEQINKLKTIK